MCGHFIVSPCVLLVSLGFIYILIFVYFWLHWVFVMCGVSLAAASWGRGGVLLFLAVQAAHRGGLSGGRARTPGCTDFSSCGSQASLLHGMRDLPRPAIEPVSPAFFTAEPPKMILEAPFASETLPQFPHL